MPLDSKDKDIAYLWDMLDAAKAVKDFVHDVKFTEYQENRMLRCAVERNIEIIGEAAGKISRDFQNANPQIPWHNIICQRHVLIHEYGEIENSLLWKVATFHIPDLIIKLSPLLSC